MAMPKITISHTANLVREKLKLKEIYSQLPKRLSNENIINTFALDLALVACSIRTGYLLDLFFPPKPVALFSRLLAELRADPRSGDAFSSIFHLYEPTSEQSFFINMKLLYSRIQPLFSRDTESSNSSHMNESVVFLHLSSPITIIDTPEDFHDLLVFLFSQSSKPEVPLSCSLPNNTSIKNSVPLSAFLLDYPVAYVPSLSHSNILSGIPLNLYESSLSFQNDTEGLVVKTIMKFSCPSILGQPHLSTYPELQPQAIITRLNNMLLERLKDVKDPSVQIFSIAHTTHTLDNVTF